jgi:DNA-binding SARP family transcriptional activator
MWFAVLGPLVVRHGGTDIPVPAGKLRVLLAELLVHANKVRSFDALAEALWDGAPPPAARATIRNHVKRLRQVLGPEVAARIVTRDPGYLVELADDELDLLRFTPLYEEGAAAIQAGAWQRASTVLGAAAELWRGTPFVDVLSPALHRDELPRLEQLRLQMVQWRIDADLHLGRHAHVVPELRAMAAEHPLRESVHEQLLLALAGCGRRSEALDAYQQARQVLVDELGIEPGPDLRQTHQRILAGDPTLAGLPAPGPIVTGPAEPILVKRRWSRARVVVLVASAAALGTAVTFAATVGGHPDGQAASPPPMYNLCPAGAFCLFNGKDGTTNYCTWITSDPVADRDCVWLHRGWKVRSVYNRTGQTVEYCAQEHYQDCVGSTRPGDWGNLPGTYTVRSVRSG